MENIKPFRHLTIEMLLKSIKAIVESCKALGLECRDPSATTTSLLKSLGYNVYQIKRFWDDIERANHKVLVLYKFRNSEFGLKFLVDEGPIYEAVVRNKLIPLDENDLKKIKAYLFAPRGRRLFMRLVGGSGGYIDINLIRILILVERKSPGTLQELIDAIEKYLKTGEVKILKRITLNLFHNFKDILSLVLPNLPENLELLIRLIPLLRRLT